MRRPGSRSGEPPGPRRGFALPTVLVTLVGLAAIATAIVPLGFSRVDHADAQHRRLEQRWLLEAGLSRGLLALLYLDDPMIEVLRRDGRSNWVFDGKAMMIELRAESGKLDLNEADSGALQEVLARSLGPRLAGEAFDNLVRMRARGERPVSPDQILPVLDRFGPAGSRIRDALTVYDGRREIDQGDHAGSTSATAWHERPIFTLRVHLSGKARALAQTVMVDPASKSYVTLERAELDVDGLFGQ